MGASELERSETQARTPAVSAVFDPEKAVSAIRDGTLDPLMLSKGQRLNCVEYLMAEEHLTGEAIARLVRRSGNTIRADITKIQNAYGRELKAGAIIDRVLGEWLYRQREIIRRALDEGDLATAARANFDFIKGLQELGVIPKPGGADRTMAPDGTPVFVTLADLLNVGRDWRRDGEREQQRITVEVAETPAAHPMLTDASVKP